MRKIELNTTDNEPVVKINWKKIWRFAVWVITGIVWIIRKIIETILKLILKILTLIVIGFYKLYLLFRKIVIFIFRVIRKFSKRNVKGFWILLILFIIFIIGSIIYTKQSSYTHNLLKGWEDTNQLLQKQREENKQLKQDIQEKDRQLQVKAEEEVQFAHQQWILNNRQIAEEKLPQKVKTVITKYAKAYEVRDTRLINCIVYHESGGRDEAVGDSGDAIGVAQYHLDTFLGHRKQMGLSVEDLRSNTEASIQAMLFSISRGGIGNWSARTKCT